MTEKEIISYIENLTRNIDKTDLKDLQENIENIKRNYTHSQNLQNYGKIQKQIYECGKMIKIFDLIQKNYELITEGQFFYFYGWLQKLLSDNISLEAYKTFEKLSINLNSILNNIDGLPDKIKSYLKKSSLFKKRLKELKPIADGIEDFRHNQLAHFSIETGKRFTYLLNILFEKISNIYSSLGHINHYLSNPQELHDYIDSKINFYKLSLLSEIAEEKSPENNTLYLSLNTEKQLTYSLKKHGDAVFTINLADSNFNTEFINRLVSLVEKNQLDNIIDEDKTLLLGILSNKGHIPHLSMLESNSLSHIKPSKWESGHCSLSSELKDDKIIEQFEVSINSLHKEVPLHKGIKVNI